jgi:hypothetical protein
VSIIGSILGVGEVTAALITTAGKLAAGARQVDDGAAEQMVSLMKSRVPRDKGLLANGITAERQAEVWEVKASATRVSSGGKPGADYASFVEDGTKPGSRARRAADRRFVDGQGGGHPGTDAQPFFWPSVREIEQRRGRAMNDFAEATAQELAA